MIFRSPRNITFARIVARFAPTDQANNFWWNISLASRVTGLLCLLPVLEKSHTLPALLARLTPVRCGEKIPAALVMERAVGLVLRLCHRRPFRSALFPKACLRQSLALYHALTYVGFPVEFHLAVRKQGQELIAHSWVTLSGKPVAEKTIPDVMKLVYSYPTKANSNQVMNGGRYGTEKLSATAA
jgi:hypothetical protein